MNTGAHRLVLEFTADGGVDFHATTDDPEELARRFARVVRTLVEYPTTVAVAAGLHRGPEHGD
jgi:hypothetical protein